MALAPDTPQTAAKSYQTSRPLIMKEMVRPKQHTGPTEDMQVLALDISSRSLSCVSSEQQMELFVVFSFNSLIRYQWHYYEAGRIGHYFILCYNIYREHLKTFK
jgi:hypothetical protein